MSAARPTLPLPRKTPLKSKKTVSGSTSGKKKTVVVSASSSATTNTANTSTAPNKPWVDTVNDLNVYKPTKEELESKKNQRKSQNKILAKVSLSDKRSLHLDPERQRLIQQQVMLDYRRQPSQNVEAILARSEQVMGICQGILNGEMITPTYQPLSPSSSLPILAEAEDTVTPAPVEEEDTAMSGLDRLRGRPSALQQPPPSSDAAAGGSASSGSASSGSSSAPPPVQQVMNPPYMNSAALNEIAGELLITVRELREELLQEREARERLEREVIQQRELLSELCREVLRLQLHCSGQTEATRDTQPKGTEAALSQQLEGTRIV